MTEADSPATADTVPSPVPSLSRDIPPSTVVPEVPTVQSVTVESGEYRRIGKGLYELAGSPSLNVRYWWTTTTNYGLIESGDTSCSVVMTTYAIPDGGVISTDRSATCSQQGWHEVKLAQGAYRIVVSVTLDSGASGDGEVTFRIVP